MTDQNDENTENGENTENDDLINQLEGFNEDGDIGDEADDDVEDVVNNKFSSRASKISESLRLKDFVQRLIDLRDQYGLLHYGETKEEWLKFVAIVMGDNNRYRLPSILEDHIWKEASLQTVILPEFTMVDRIEDGIEDATMLISWDISFPLDELMDDPYLLYQIPEAVSESIAIGLDQRIYESVDGYDGVDQSPSTDPIALKDIAKVDFPSGYSPKWFMNSNDGIRFAALKDENGNFIFKSSDDHPDSVPEEMLDRFVVYNEWTDDGLVLLADLKAAYQFVKPVFYAAFVDEYVGHDDLKGHHLLITCMRFRGKLIHPEAVKRIYLEGNPVEAMKTPEP